MAVGSAATYLNHATTGLIANIDGTEQTLTFNGTATDSADVVQQSGNTAHRIQNSGRYLIIAKTGWDFQDIGNNFRHVMSQRIKVGGSDLASICGRSSCYGRDSGSADEGHTVSIGYVDHTVVGDASDDITVTIQNVGDTANSTADEFGAQGSLQVIRMPDDSEWLRVSRTTNTTVTPGGYATPPIYAAVETADQYQTITWENELEETDSAEIEWEAGTPTQVTVKTAGWYLVIYNIWTFDTANRSGALSKLMVNDARVDGQSHVLTMTRDHADGSDDAWAALPMFLDLSADDELTVDIVNVSEGTNDPSLYEACLTVIQLPADVKIVSVFDSTSRADETAGVIPFDAENNDPDAQHDLVTNNSRIYGTSDENDWLFVGGYLSDMTATNSVRVCQHFRWSLNGGVVQGGDFLGYHRGDQSSVGVGIAARHGARVFTSLGSSDYVELDKRHETVGTDEDRDTVANYNGMQALDLSTLVAGGAATYEDTGADAADGTDTAATHLDAGAEGAEIADGSDTAGTRIEGKAEGVDAAEASDSASASVAAQTYQKSAADIVDGSDSTTTRLEARPAETDAADVSESLRIGIEFELPGEQANVSDTATSAIASKTYQKSAADIAESSDSVAERLEARPAETDGATASDSAVSNLVGGIEAGVDAADASDSATTYLRAGAEGADTAEASDSAACWLEARDDASDTAEASDSAAARPKARVDGSDVAEVGDSAVPRIEATNAGIDAADVSDSVATRLEARPTSADQADVSDTVQVQLVPKTVISDTADVSDSATTYLKGKAEGVDAALVSDGAVVASEGDNVGADTADVSDAATTRLEAKNTEADAAEGADSATGRLEATDAGADAVDASDTATAKPTARAASADAADASDAATAWLELRAAATDAAETSDSAVAASVGAGVGVDAADASDAATTRLKSRTSPSDTASVSDAALASIIARVTVTDVADASDSASSATEATTDTGTDAADASDSAATRLEARATGTDAADISDAATAIVIAVERVADAIVASDTPSDFLRLLEAVSDALVASDVGVGDLGVREQVTDETLRGPPLTVKLTQELVTALQGHPLISEQSNDLVTALHGAAQTVKVE